ncbi:hypothetical protein [Mucisphaera calidilacus]|uniref:General secretion pathway protein K n=1 Tax=Mucisphaera calidilacus TaxID=2527982 RepID=A0A518BUE7_9BACT|nr:hypothetical protein [Mucisphaera calidilacus]QDU70612.1 General secretion pathway protein K [Mucisphaera calidilacus]
MSEEPTIRHHPHNAGFALILVLVLVMIAGSLLSAYAHHSAVTALETRDAAEALQRRWATISMRATLLERVHPVLLRAEDRGLDGRRLADTDAQPVAIRTTRVTLADQPYTLTLSDEQAKVDVSAVVREQGTPAAERWVRRLLRQTSGSRANDLTIHLQPIALIDDAQATTILTFGQVFDRARPEQFLARGTGGQPAPVDAITCWSSGKLNYQRASDDALRLMCEPVLGIARSRRLIEARDEDPFQDMEVLLRRAGATDPKSSKEVRAVLTERSRCHGLWITAHGTQRDWYSAIIGIGDPDLGTLQTRTLEW